MKRLLVIALCLLMIPILSFVAIFAHPGRTDGSGGHYDRDTGSYHYHHGYPAHQHSDLDGDGKADCPYNFKDVGNSNNSNKNHNKKDDTEHKYKNNQTTKKTKSKLDEILRAGVAIAIVFLPFILSFAFELLQSTISRFKRR